MKTKVKEVYEQTRENVKTMYDYASNSTKNIRETMYEEEFCVINITAIKEPSKIDSGGNIKNASTNCNVVLLGDEKSVVQALITAFKGQPDFFEVVNKAVSYMNLQKLDGFIKENEGEMPPELKKLIKMMKKKQQDDE